MLYVIKLHLVNNSSRLTPITRDVILSALGGSEIVVLSWQQQLRCFWKICFFFCGVENDWGCMGTFSWSTPIVLGRWIGDPLVLGATSYVTQPLSSLPPSSYLLCSLRKNNLCQQSAALSEQLPRFCPHIHLTFRVFLYSPSQKSLICSTSGTCSAFIIRDMHRTQWELGKSKARCLHSLF